MNGFRKMIGASIAATMLLLPAAVSADPGGKENKGGANADHGAGKGAGKKHIAAPNPTSRKADVVGAREARRPADRRAMTDVTSRRVMRPVRADDFFDRNDETQIRRYFGTSISCPPGLAAKNNGCLPPGQAKKSYAVGTILPRNQYLAPLPGDLLGRLPVAPSGYYYGRYNGDVYLVENTTRRIVDTMIFNLLR